MQYERLVSWAQQTWDTRNPGVPYVTIWASSECSNKIAQEQVKPGRRLKGKAKYAGFQPIECPVVTSISDYGARGRKMVLTSTSGAYVFTFQATTDPDNTFEILYTSAYFDEDGQDLTCIALVPENRLETWAAFESACALAVRPRIKRRRDVYIVGGNDAYFDPTVEWDDVILPEPLKSRLYEDMEAFFKQGVGIYKELKLAPFRKLLLAGIPGTGKTMLCAAMAKLAINEKRIVVYVSGADRDGASFEKIQRALQAVAAAQYPVLLIVEEIDAYLQGDDKARVLNVLDGVESPNNPKGALMLATTNYPEVIDERIAKRPGRLDRIFIIPPIENEDQAERMLRHYMAEQWHDDHASIVPGLVGQPGAFVREVALHARMLAAHEAQTDVTLDLLEMSIDTLADQLKAGADFLERRRSVGLVQNDPGRVQRINPSSPFSPFGPGRNRPRRR
jgi:energy-coupling factor transporter ATP-binding protein EcfA2